MSGWSRCCFRPRLGLALSGLCLAALAGLAAPPSPWSARVWQSDDGLPENNVTGVAQTPEGYLWVATHNGLVRFDGVRFREVPLPVPSGRTHPLIRAMVLGQGNTLWLALEGGVAVSLSATRTNVFTSTNGLPNFRPLCVTQNAAGDVWIGYADGSACRIAGEQVTRFTARDGLAGLGGCWLVTDAAGQLWFAKSGRVGVWRDNQFVALLNRPGESLRLGRAHSGGIWVGTSSELLRLEAATEPVKVAALNFERGGVEPSILFEDRAGAVWLGTAAGGLWRWKDGALARAETSHSDINCITEDREGSVWVGTGGGGLNRLRPRVVEVQGLESGLPSETVRSICEDASGALWATTGNGGLVRRQEGRWKTPSRETGWTGARATCVASDLHGGVWVGTYREGLHHLRDGKSEVLQRSNGLAGDTVRALLVDRAKNLWIALEAGNSLQRLKEGQLQTFTQPVNSRTIRAIAEDAAGHIWLGTLDGFLLSVEGDKLVDETPRTLPRPKPIRCLAATPDGSLWIGYASAGLGRLRDGRFARIGVEQGLHDGNICAIMPDSDGGVWFGSDRGLFQVRQHELNEVAEGRSTRVLSILFGRDEGLQNLQISYGYAPSAARTRDGRIFMPLRTGVAEVHADRIQRNRVPPPVIIEGLALDGQPVGTAAATRVELPPQHRKLDVEFTALSFVAPESVRFRYRMEGWDEDWIDAGPQRSAGYSRLPAGEYRFRVTACNSAGVWSQAGATMSFVVQPFFWQLWWFRAGAVSLFTGVVIATVRYVSFRRLRHRLEALEREAALNKERARIAQDIHDDLGASLTQISLLGELARHDLAQPAQAAAHVDKITATARQGIKSLDEIVWAVNPRNDTLPHLTDYVGQFAVDFLRAAGVRCRVDFPAQLPALTVSTDVRHNLFLVAKEALHNIVKHAQASEVWLRVNVADATLRLIIEDNGRGFAQAPDDAWADGLRNMRQRMAEIGGGCEIESRPGTGTRITCQVPLSANAVAS